MDGAFRQYVILGAGLDSFAWRRPDLVGALKVFEVDRPSTQAWKRSRIESLALLRMVATCATRSEIVFSYLARVAANSAWSCPKYCR